MSSQIVLYISSTRTADQTHSVQQLLSKDRRISWISEIGVCQASISAKTLQTIAKKVSFLFPPPAIIVSTWDDYGRLNEFANWIPLYERCRNATFVLVSQYSRDDKRFDEENRRLSRLKWSTIEYILKDQQAITSRSIPLNYLHIAKDQDTLTAEQKAIVSMAFKPEPISVSINRLWNRFVAMACKPIPRVMAIDRLRSTLGNFFYGMKVGFLYVFRIGR